MQENSIRSQEIKVILNEKDHYKILGIDDNSDFETISKAYRDLAKKYHPDLFASLSNREEAKEFESVFTKITIAFNKLKSPESRKKYDDEKKLRKTLNEAQSKPNSPINIKSPISTTLQFEELNKSINFDIKQRKSDEAETFFNYGLSLYNQNKLEEAINNFQSAIKMDAKIAKYHSYLAMVMKKKGWHGYAQAEFKVALHYDPNDKIARKNYISQDHSSNQKTEVKSDQKKTGYFDNLTRKIFKTIIPYR